jgi:CRISPR-associated protein Csm3
MRSLMEKEHALPQNTSIGHQVKMHICKDAQEYAQCPVCKTFGIPGEYEHSETSRLIVRDALMTDASADELDKARTDLPYTEVKWEAAIDRVTSAATPRQQERVPAGALFHGELVFSLYNHEQHADNLYELDLFAHVLQALELVELDYLGGQGSRGSGKIEFLVHELRLRQNSRYTEQPLVIPAKKDDDAKKSVPLSLQELRDEWTNLRTRM